LWLTGTLRASTIAIATVKPTCWKAEARKRPRPRFREAVALPQTL
jgi:hypothetical protein